MKVVQESTLVSSACHLAVILSADSNLGFATSGLSVSSGEVRSHPQVTEVRVTRSFNKREEFLHGGRAKLCT
jgi:hypothetical protein